MHSQSAQEDFIYFYSGPDIQRDESNTNYPFTAPAATPLIICF